jgi:hypothetical protein
MPALRPTGFVGRVTWAGQVPDRAAGLASAPRDALVLTFAGPQGEAHAGLTRPSCSRVLAQYPRGTTIRNTRQLSVLAAEDLAVIAARMGLERLDPALVGASLVIEGIPDFSHIPPGSRLQGAGGATLVVDLENRPCQLPARPIEAAHPGFGARFRRAAAGRRGITAWVECEGRLSLGEAIRLHVPDQPVWAHLEEARRG